jgi:xanthine dehydrogenase accessory factor
MPSSSDVLARALALRAAHTPFVLATVVAAYPPQSARPGAKAIVHADGTVDGWVGGGCVRPIVVREAAEALAEGRGRLVRMNAGGVPAGRESTGGLHEGVRDYPMTCQGEGGLEVYLEPMLPAPELLVIGHTPVAQALARLGRELDFEVSVAAPTVAAALFPEGVLAFADPAPAAAALGASGSIVVATMGSGDEEALEAAVRSRAGYVGLVASRKKGAFLIDYLAGLGVPRAQLARVRCPAGIDLGGMRAPEIALSILAEIVGLRHAGDRGAAGAGAPPRHHDAPAAAGDPHPSIAARPVRTRQAGHLPLAPVAPATPATATPATGAPAPPGAAHADASVVDPVCGMTVDSSTARHTSTVDGRTVYFCCPRCKATFDRQQAPR